MHPAFECFEWATPEDRHPHPSGEPVAPDGPWENAVLSLRRTGEDVGDAWYLADGEVLSVVVRVAEKNGGRDDPWLLRLLADALFGEDGYGGGYYERRTRRVRYRNVTTGGVWEGTWEQMRGKG